MATMYVGGGLYLPTTGTASKPKTTSTPTGGTVTVAQRNAIASKTKPATTTVAKKPTTNTLSSMAGSSLGTTSTKKPTTTTAAKKPTTNTLSSMAGTSLGTTSSRSTNPLSTMAGRTLGINAALPQPPRLTKAQIGNRFTQSLAAGAKTGAAVPNPAGLTRDEADTFRSRFYTDFYSGKPVQRIVDSPVFQPGMMGRGQPVPSYDYLFGARNDDKPYVSAYDVSRYGSMSQGQPGMMPLPGRGEPGDYLGQLYRSTLATGAGAGNAIMAPLVGLGYGVGDALDGGDMVQDFLRGYGQGERGVNQYFAPTMELDPSKARKAGDIVNVGSIAGMLPGVGMTAIPRAAATSLPRAAEAGIAAVVPQTARLPAAANLLDEGFVQRAAELNDQRLLANMMRENDARSLTNAIDENDAGVLSNAMRENDMLNALNTAREVRPARGSELFPDINPAATISDPMDVLRPVFMSADEAADVIRPGPRVAADAGMDPVTKRMLLAAGGAGVAIPGLAGLSLLANGQLTPAPPATTPQPGAVPDGQRGIDAVDPRAAYAGAQSSMRDAMSARLPGGENQVLIPTKDGTIILPAPKKVAPAVEPSRGSIYPAWVSKAKGDAYNEANPEVADSVAIDNLPIDSDVPITAEEQAKGGGRGAPASGEQGDEADTAAPAAGKKFTPGPGQFVGTNGYIYEQSSDGSFEQVGRVPGYTPAQLSEAANKGAFRDPNNIVVGSGKRTKKDSTESLGVTNSGSKKRKKKDEDETDESTGGTDGTGTGTYTPPTQAMLDALYAPYMRQYTGPGVGYVPGVDPERNYFTPAFADGGLVDGRLVLGDGGPKEDKIPAMIDGVEQAKLSNGEFVMTAAAVKNAGGGDIELGAKRLMDLNNMLSYGRPAERLKVQHVK